jgi:uncharacterized protein involved in exopolysaccharide biosynthesis
MPETTLWSSSILRDVWGAVVRHKWKAAACFFIITGSAAVLTLLIPKTYQSEGKLFVRLGRENATLDSTVTLGPEAVVAVPLSRESEINSVVEILRSRPLLERVADAIGPAALLHAGAQTEQSAGSSGWLAGKAHAVNAALGSLARLPRQWLDGQPPDERQRAVSLLAKSLDVEVARKSNVVQVLFSSRSPEVAQAVVSRLMTFYLDEHARLNRPQGAHQFFGEQTSRLHDELLKREAALCDLKTATALTAPEQQRQTLVARLGRLQDDLLQTEAAEAALRTKVEQLQRRAAGLPATLVLAHTEGVGDEGTDRMREQLYVLRLKHEEARSRYTEAHPKMQQLKDQIGEAQAIVAGQQPTRTQVTTGPSRVYEEAQTVLLTEEPRLASLETEVGGGRGPVEGLQPEPVADCPARARRGAVPGQLPQVLDQPGASPHRPGPGDPADVEPERGAAGQLRAAGRAAATGDGPGPGSAAGPAGWRRPGGGGGQPRSPPALGRGDGKQVVAARAGDRSPHARQAISSACNRKEIDR